jgi:hypothetical protein
MQRLQWYALIIMMFSFSCCAISESVLEKRHDVSLLIYTKRHEN